MDNSTSESTYYQGYSTSWKLSGIILWIYQAIQDGVLIFHVIHVAGTRMKAWGIHGLSRGNLLEGIMAGEDPLSFVSLADGADKRFKGKVGKCVRSWWKESEWGNPGKTFP